MKSMLKSTLALLALVGLLATSGQALASKQVALTEARLNISDNAGLFSLEARSKAKAEFAKLKTDYECQVTIYTIKELSGPDLEDQKKAKADKTEGRFWHTYAERMAKDDRDKGIFILICRSPGYVEIIADKQVRAAGLKEASEEEISKKFYTSFYAAKGKPEAEAQTLRDSALVDVAKILHDVVPAKKASNRTTTAASHEGMPIWGWVCIGLAVVAVLWLIIGMVRGGGGSGGGGGGGGGGFFSGLLGGMFGAMAGMWMYNNLFGGSSYGDSGYGGGDGGDTGGDTGAGDFGGDSGAGGGWDDGGGGGGGGDFGGGDFGGGGGDF